MKNSCIAAILPRIAAGAHSTIHTVALTLAIPLDKDLILLNLILMNFYQIIRPINKSSKQFGSHFAAAESIVPGTYNKHEKIAVFFLPSLATRKVAAN